MGSFKGPLGAWANKTLAERTQLYRQQEVIYLDDDRAGQVDRVVWLKDENLREPFHRVLDIGCHDGFTTRWLRNEPQMARLLGIDPSPQAIEIAAAHVDDPRIDYYEKAWQDAPAYQSFNVVVAFELFEHFLPVEVSELLETIHAGFMVPFGPTRLYICTPNRYGIWGETNDDPCHIHLFTKDSLEDILRESSFRDAELTWHQYYENCPHLQLKVVSPCPKTGATSLLPK